MRANWSDIIARHFKITHQLKSKQGIPSGWGNWNVAADTVINISVEVDFPVKKLAIRNLQRYKWYTDDSLTTYYRLNAQGLEYEVQSQREIGITYGPTTKDKLCFVKRMSQRLDTEAGNNVRSLNMGLPSFELITELRGSVSLLNASSDDRT